MSIPSQVLENGQYVTRMLDPYQILARNRVRQEEQHESVAEPAKAPVCALLTQTLVRTPSTKWIFPARLRYPDTTDVIFVSEDTVEIREAFQEFPMALLCTKGDFDSPIRNAALIGKAKPVSAFPPGWVDDIKTEDDDTAGSRASDSSAGMTKKDRAKPTTPPQMLVLVLESAQLIFLYIACKSETRPDVAWGYKQLPVSSARLHQVGEFVVVDPDSRALAIGAQERYFYLYSLRSKPPQEEALSKDTFATPIDSERQFSVDGVILNMEFLYPSEGDHDHVILLLVVSKKERSRLVWYEWDTRVDLVDADIKPSSFSLPEELSLPLLLIPLKAHNAFILVGHSTTCVYKNILTGTPSQYVLQLGTSEELEQPATSTYRPIWVQWARAVRYPTLVASPTQALRADDNVYLCREDGLVLFLDIKNSLSHMVESHHSAGRLGARINNAFAVIDLGEYAIDLLVAGGDSGYGGVWQFSPRENAVQAHTLTNWSPLIDITCIASTGARDTSGCVLEDDENDAVLACTGSSSRGSMSQLKFGIGVTSLDTLRLQHTAGPPIMDAWTAYAADHTSYVIISYPVSTLLIKMKEGMTPEPLDSHEGFVLDDRTILIEGLPLGNLCQVTSRTIVLSEALATTSPRILWRDDVGAGEEITLACVNGTYESLCLITAVSRRDIFKIVFHTLQQEGHTIQCQISLEAHPTSMAMQISLQAGLLVVGNDTGSLEAFRLVQKEQTFEYDQIVSWHLSNSDQICDSIVLCFDNKISNSSCINVVCGLRNGSIHTFELDCDARRVVPAEQIYVGDTTVRIKQVATQPRDLYVGCDDKLFTLELPSASATWCPATLRLVNHFDKTSKTLTAKVLAFIPPQIAQQSLHLRARFLVTITSIGIHFSLFDTAEFEIIPRRRRPTAELQDSIRMELYRQFSNHDLTVVPRPFELEGRPIRAIYSGHLKQVIVLSSNIKKSRSSQGHVSRRGTEKRKAEGAITFVNTGTSRSTHFTRPEDIEAESIKEAQHTQYSLSLKPGERLVNIVEWFPKINDMEYHLLLINTLVKDRRKAAAGRLQFYAVTTVARKVVKLELKKSLDIKHPVYSVAILWDRSSIIYGSGNELTVLTLRIESMGLKYESQSQLTMRSPARYLTVHEPYIYVSTANQSCQVYSYRNQQIQYQHGDTIARNGICHIAIPETRMLVATDLNGSVTGLWQPPINQVNNAMATIFEAKLSKAITRFFQVRSSSSRRDFLVPGGAILLAEDVSPLPKYHSEAVIYDYRPGAIIGTSIDGTFTQMSIIEKGWQLLVFVQRLCEEDQGICPFRSTASTQRLEASSDRPRDLHINGDILKRLFTEDGTQRLLSSLQEPALSGQGDVRLAHDELAGARWEQFFALSSEVLGQNFVKKAAGKDIIVQEVLRWIAYVTRSAL